MSELKKLFEYLSLAEYKHITKDFVKRCSGEYTSAIINIPERDRKNYSLIDYLLKYCENENWKSAMNSIDLASKEYTKLRSKLPDEFKHKDQDTDRAKSAEDTTVADKRPAEPPADYDGAPDPRRMETKSGDKENTNENKPNYGGARNTHRRETKSGDRENTNENRSSCGGAPDQLSQGTETKSRNRENTNENKRKSSDLAHLQHSKEAGHQMKHNNPNIADLSDTNRPTKIAERYSELYDNQWTEAYEALMKVGKLTEETTIKCLLQIVQKAFKYCKDESEKQITSMQSGFQNILRGGGKPKDTNGNTKSNESDTSLLVQYRKDIAELALTDLQQTFWTNPDMLHKICSSINLSKKPSENGPVANYARRCVELTWWMCVQSPPICMHDCDDKLQKFDSSLYRAYTKSGKELAFFVWPALYLHEGGPVLMKGVAQCR